MGSASGPMKRVYGAILEHTAPNLWATDTRSFQRVVTVGDNWIAFRSEAARFPGSGERSPRRIEG